VPTERPRRRRRLLLIAGGLVVLLVIPTCSYLHRMAGLAAGYVAKERASAHFLTARDNHQELLEDHLALSLVSVHVDHDRRSVHTDIWGGYRRTAVYRPGLGVALAIEDEPAAVRAQSLQRPVITPHWPQREPVLDDHGIAADLPAGWDRSALATVVERACAADAQRTRALVVVHADRIVVERYAPGFARDSLFCGWSMTKTVMNALIGAAVDDGLLTVAEPARIPAWSPDRRPVPSIDDLLRMRSGIAFSEWYGGVSDVIVMLYGTGDSAGYAAAQPQASAPGDEWDYSSGDSNLLAWDLRQRLGEADYLRYPYQRVFAPLGMADALLEVDAAGNWVASSSLWATARDWARFGRLYAHGGTVDGRRVFDRAWLDYTLTPTPTPERVRSFGAHVWLNRANPDGERWMPALPESLYSMWGHFGQFVTILPEQDLIVVRLGLSKGSWDHEAFLHSLLVASGQGRTAN